MNKNRKSVAIGALILALLLPTALVASRQITVAPSPEQQFLAMVREFLDFGRDYAEFCENKKAVAVTATTGIKDLYGGDADQAEELINELLEDTESQVIRNALPMALKDVYEEAGQRDKAVGQLAKLIRENN